MYKSEHIEDYKQCYLLFDNDHYHCITNPKGFLATLNDPELQFQAKIRLFFEEKLLALRNNDKEIWFNTPTNKKKMVSVPYGEDPFDMAAYFLSSDDGIDSLKMLEANLPQ